MQRTKLSLILLAALLVATYAVYRHPHRVRAQAADNPNKPPGPPESHRLVGPLFIQNDQFSSFITLVDNTMTDLYADVVVNATDGEQVAKTRVYLAGHGTRVIQLADILGAAASRVSYGSITIIPQESLALMPILAQVSMVRNADSDRPEYLESEPMMPGMSMTNLLEGVAVEPVHAPVVAVTNTSAVPRTVSVSCLSNSGRDFPEQSIRMQGGATRMIRVCENQHEDSGETASHLDKAKALGILLSYDGKPGGVLAFGYSSFGESGQLVSIPFSDGGTSQSSKIAWPGVPVGFSRGLTWGEFEPEIAVANFSSQQVDATISYWRTEDGTPESQEVRSVHLGPRSAQAVTLHGLDGSRSMENSFVLKQTGRPQDVAATLISVNRLSDQIVQLVPKDPQQMENGGGHPWTIENGVDSTLLLFNPAGKAITFTVNIPIGDKKLKLWSKLYVLQPGETKSISLRELVEARAKDKDGVPLPKNLQGGEVTWLTPDPGEGLGRIIQTDESRLLARNFSCGNYIVLCSNSLANSDANLIVGFDGFLGDSEPEFCTAYYVSACSGQLYGYGYPNSFGWSTSNSAVAPISGSTTSSSATFYGNQTGSATGYGTVYTNYCSATAYGNASPTNQTPSSHTYPNAPLPGPCSVLWTFDHIVNRNTNPPTKHRAQDVTTQGIGVGTPVYAADGGTIDSHVSGQPHDPRSEQGNPPPCAGQHDPVDYVKVNEGNGNITGYYHVTMLPSLSNGTTVKAGQQIGTVDKSGCTNSPHAHIQRTSSGNLVNFTLPCSNNFGPGGQAYDDGP